MPNVAEKGLVQEESSPLIAIYSFWRVLRLIKLYYSSTYSGCLVGS